jgi:hypothetical protein
MRLFGRKRPVVEHPYFGRMTHMPGEYWEAELVLSGEPEKIGVTMPASEEGPSAAQVEFCRHLLGDLDALFARCRPVFEGDFETWTEVPFPDDWRPAFVLVGLGLPADGDESRPWDVTYFVEAASHYFTAYFEDGVASYLTVDG